MTVGALPRSAEGPADRTRDRLLRVFGWGNRTVMLPLLSHRHVGSWMGSPVAGWFAVLTTTGRRSGLPRRTPLNYAIVDGCVYVVSGFGTRADWFRNLLADPRVTVALPGRVLPATAAVVTDPAEADTAMLAVARNCGFALVFEGLDPLTVTDQRLREQLAGRPVVRLTADAPVVPGRHDPGSPWWVLPRAVAALALVGVAVAVGQSGRVIARGSTHRS
jgi:deazaflavin-dependent oxidoreductase (nitroreductase family)